MGVKVTLGGVVLAGPVGFPGAAIPWDLRAGTSPTEYALEVTERVAAELESQQGKPLTYQVEGGRKPLQVQQVYLLEIHPGRIDHTRVLRVADRRWKWPRPHLEASCNVRRATGERFLVGDEQLLENQEIEDRIRYATYSLFPPEAPNAPWTAAGLLRWAFEEIGKQLEEDQPYRIQDALPQVEIQDLRLTGTGADVLEEVLRYLPGMDVFLDRDGAAVIYDTRAPGAAEVLSRLQGQAHLAGAYARMVDRRATRPRFVRVLFDPEVECKFTFREGGTRTQDSTDLSNVLASPDLSLTLSDGTRVARGTWLELDDAFSAWGAFGLHNKAISTTELRKRALRAGAASLEAVWGNDPKVPYVDGQAASRARAAVRYWRRAYALERIFFGRLLSVRAQRVAIVSKTTGRRAESRAYCDWTRKPALFAIAKPTDPNTSAGWSTAGFAEALNDSESAPADVVVRDPQAGVIEVLPELDPEGRASAMVLGRPADGILPDIRIGQANRLGSAIWALWDKIELGATFNLHTVLTVVPGTPNDVRRLWAVDVQSSDVEAGAAEGPPVYVRVYPGVATARFAWSDGASEQIVAGIKGASPLPTERLVDKELLDEVAKATARRVYDLFRDEPLGTLQVDMDPELQPVGSLSSVRHAVVSGGATVTQAHFSGVKRPVDIWRYLPASARRALLHVLEDGSVSS